MWLRRKIYRNISVWVSPWDWPNVMADTNLCKSEINKITVMHEWFLAFIATHWTDKTAISLSHLSVFCFVVCVSGKEFLAPSESPWTLYSLAEENTRLPCRFNTSDSEVKIVQVMWIREKLKGGEEQIITAHFSEGQTGNKK